jgi:predicted MFS family arabinose efflux permease
MRKRYVLGIATGVTLGGMWFAGGPVAAVVLAAVYMGVGASIWFVEAMTDPNREW